MDGPNDPLRCLFFFFGCNFKAHMLRLLRPQMSSQFVSKLPSNQWPDLVRSLGHSIFSSRLPGIVTNKTVSVNSLIGGWTNNPKVASLNSEVEGY